MTYSSKTPCPDRVLPSTTVWFFQRETKQSLHTPHFTLHSSHSKLQTSHSTLHTSHFSLLPSHSKPHTSHFTLRSSHSKLKLHTPHFTLHTSHFSLPTASFTLHTALFTPHTSHCSKPTFNKKTLVPKWRKSANKSIRKTLRMQPKQEATLTQPFQCDLRRLSCKTQENYAQWRRKL